MLGDILHSRPTVIHYSTSHSVIYVGANDGMLHAFEDSDGEELWGFIPPDLLNTLKSLTILNITSTHPYYVDGSPRAFIIDANNNGTISSDEGDKAILVIGERRGGSSYYAIDVTDADIPVYLWRIGTAIADPVIGSVWSSSEFGQSWSEPEIVKMVIGGETKYVFFIGGGYDKDNEDALPPLTLEDRSNPIGRAVFAVDVLTGEKLWEYS
ncbi:MAG TPA: hypothetical protein DCR39_05975, partial [Nitrospiraceae bacterium]|nr:hypothetical protein [Nitrospiraceae bacterium]